MRINTNIVAAIVMAGLSLPAIAYDVQDLAGTYVSDAKGFVHIKKLTISKDDNGKIKVRVTLAGFPDDIYLGEATAEVYPDRDGQPGDDKFLASLSNGKLTDLIEIGHGTRWVDFKDDVSVKSFMKYADGRPSVVFNDILKREQISK